MNIRICDYCGERKGLKLILLTNRPNDEAIKAELCPTCIADIVEFVNRVNRVAG